MISDETKRKLRELGLDELNEILKVQDKDQALYTSMPFDERLNLTIEGLIIAVLKDLLSKLDLDLPMLMLIQFVMHQICLDKNQMIELSTCQYIRNNTSLVLHGFTWS